jgi:DNA-binding CsgD family transcriptional regulator
MGYAVPDQALATLISEAALDPAKWPAVCQAMSAMISGHGALMFPLGPEPAKLGLPHSESLHDSFQHYIRDEWYKRDLRYSSIEVMRKRNFTTDADCIRSEDVDKSDYYQDFLRPNKLKWYVGMGVGEGPDFWVFSVQQSIDKSPFNETEIRKILAYRDILANAAAISRQLGFAKIIGAETMMEQQGRAVIALDFDGRVIHISATAEKYAGKAFQIVNRRLQACEEKYRRPLETLIASLSNKNLSLRASSAVPLSNGADNKPLVVYGTVLPVEARQPFYHATALLMFVDPERELSMPLDLLMQYFDITRAEAKLAISLLQGKSVEKHSLENSISPVTSRNHLQGLLRKTGSHSKVEVIAKLNSIKPV